MFYSNSVSLDAHLFENTKIKLIRSKPEGHTYLCFWIYLLTMGARIVANSEIERPDFEPYSIDDLAVVSGFSPRIIQEALVLFEDLYMITRDKGLIRLKNWDYYQNRDDIR